MDQAGKEAFVETVPWRIQLFGKLAAQHGERRITHFKTEKVGLLLASLAYEPRRHYRREELTEQLWPGETLEASRNNFRVALSFLRQILEPRQEERGSLLKADREVVYLNENNYATDSAEFERNLVRATRAREDAERIQYLQAAVEGYQGDFLLEYDAL
jgi:DNA-binding SARP family transcriptional activator